MAKVSILGGILVLALGGCGGGGGAAGGGGGGGGDETSGGEYGGPIGSTDVTAGEASYNSRCGSCHGGGGAPELANIGWTPERMRRQIREGSGQMPPIRENRLSNEDMEAVLAYLVSIGGVSDGGAAAEPAAE